MYPFRVRIKDPELERVFTLLAQNKSVIVKDKGMVIKAGRKLKPIRKDVFIGPDRKYYQSCIALPPKLDITIEPAYGKRRGKDFIFNSLF